MEEAPEAVSAPAAGQGEASKDTIQEKILVKLGDIHATPVERHIADIARPKGWTVADDIELMELSIQGRTAIEVADIMQQSQGLITGRFDYLVGRSKGQAARFDRKDVLAALQAQAGAV